MSDRIHTNVSFNHNFGGRASASHLASVTIATEGGRVIATVSEPSEFRIRENGTVTIYSRKHPSTSVYGVSPKGRRFIAIARNTVTTPATVLVF